MKLTNHIRDNSYTVDTYVMRGTIEMTFAEYLDAVDYLVRQYQKAKKECLTYVRDGLAMFSHFQSEDCEIEQPKGIVSFGVCANKLLAMQYDLKHYKDQNYGIKIVK